MLQTIQWEERTYIWWEIYDEIYDEIQVNCHLLVTKHCITASLQVLLQSKVILSTICLKKWSSSV